MWELRTTHALLKIRGVLGWWRWEGGGYWHLRRTFPLQWKQSNQLQHSKEFTSHPPCPTSPPPPPPLHYHIKAPSSEQVFSFKNGSEAESGRGRGQDRGSRSRPKTEFAFIPLWCASICAREIECVCGCASSSLCLLARKHCRKISGDTKGLLTESFTSCNEEKSIHIPEADNGAYRGSE